MDKLTSSTRIVGKDATALIGAPADPLPADIVNRLVTGLASIEGLIEAHLPWVFIKDYVDPAGFVLFLLVGGDFDEGRVQQQLGAALARSLPRDLSLGSKIVKPENPMLPTIRGAGCQIFGSPNKGKPGFWARLFGR